MKYFNPSSFGDILRSWIGSNSQDKKQSILMAFISNSFYFKTNNSNIFKQKMKALL